MKYKLFNDILEKICNAAPDEYKSYKDASDDGKNKAKSKAFIHLFLKVKFGINEFQKRHECITDGAQDGGLDAYYIDYDNKKIYLIQSKFRISESNFENKEICLDELMKMETERILKGERDDYKGNEYNSKIIEFQNKLKNIDDCARYEYKVIILGNLKKYTHEQIQSLMGTLPFEIFDFNRTYDELVYPVCISTFYNENNIDITINLKQRNINNLYETFQTSFGECEVTIVFVPVKEIGQAMLKYKNSLLKYNPRNYLSLSKNKVNKDIRDSIIANDNGDFAILNNGITLLCDELSLSDKTGRKNTAQIIIKNPQFINGGQTAYTLGKIAESKECDKLTEDKKVMLKIITIECDDDNKNEQYIKFIENISNATNKQTKVEEADRRANDSIQIKLQRYIYKKYSLFYERKNGEYETAISEGYLPKNLIISRTDFLRASLAFKGDPTQARSSSGDKLFEMNMFNSILSSEDEFDYLMIAYKVFSYLVEKEKSAKKNNENDYGEALRYGKYAVVYVSGIYIKRYEKISEWSRMDIKIKKIVDMILVSWKKFEKQAMSNPANSKYFGQDKREYLSYYKSNNLIIDIDAFFVSKFTFNNDEIAAVLE